MEFWDGDSRGVVPIEMRRLNEGAGQLVQSLNLVRP